MLSRNLSLLSLVELLFMKLNGNLWPPWPEEAFSTHARYVGSALQCESKVPNTCPCNPAPSLSASPISPSHGLQESKCLSASARHRDHGPASHPGQSEAPWTKWTLCQMVLGVWEIKVRSECKIRCLLNQSHFRNMPTAGIGPAFPHLSGSCVCKRNQMLL